MQITKETEARNSDSVTTVYMDQTRRREIRDPWFLLRRTIPDVTRLFYLSAILGAIGLCVTRIAYGEHSQADEIVVIATPLVISYLGIRLLRTRIAPNYEKSDQTGESKIGVQDVLITFFALALVLLTLLGLSVFVYKFLGITWAESAGCQWLKRGCFLTTGLAAAIFMCSDAGWRRMHVIIGWCITVPGWMRRRLECWVPRLDDNHPLRPGMHQR